MLADASTRELHTPLMISDGPSPHTDIAKPQHAAVSFDTHTLAPSSTTHTRPTIPGLTGLRAVLMMHVLMRNMYLGPGSVDMLGWMVGAGAVGVSNFFVLSGFILAYCYGDHRFDTCRCYWSFIGRRYARLFPIYLLSQLMCVGEQVNTVRKYGTNVWTYLHWAAYLTGTDRWMVWPEYELSDNPAWRGMRAFNPSMWALSCVLFFYVTMPVLMRVIRWYVGVDRLSELPRGRSTSRLLHLVVLCVVVMAVWLLIGQYTGVLIILYIPYSRVWEFALGLVLAALHLSITARHKQQLGDHGLTSAAAPDDTDRPLNYLASTPLLNDPLALDVVMALTIALVILLALPTIDLPQCFATGTWLAGVIGYIILTIALTNGKGGLLNRLLSTRLLQELGSMSFCFYAFHYVPLIYAESIGLPANRSAAIELCAGIGLAWLGYRYVETPVYVYLSSKLPSCRCHRL